MTSIEDFRAAMEADGLIPPAQIQGDNEVYRCPTTAKRKKRNAAYCFDLRTGTGWWRDHGGNGELKLWPPAGANGRAKETPEQEAKRLAAQKAAIEKRHKAAEAAAAAAARRWDKAKPAEPTHPYLRTKGIKPNGLRQDGDILLVPVRDAAGKLHTLQTIPPSGDPKLFGKGSATRGYYFTIGDLETTPAICIGEGFATMARVHEMTGVACIVAFSSHNLVPATDIIGELYPDALLILCADDDHKTPGNPGLTCAKRAASHVPCAVVAVPASGPERDDGATDFADMGDYDAVTEIINDAIAEAQRLREARAKVEAEQQADGQDAPPPPTEEPDVVDPPSAPDPVDPIVERLRQMFDKPTGWVDPDYPPEIAAAMLEPTALAIFNYRFAMAFVGKHRYVFDKTKPLHFMSRVEFAAAWAGIKVDSRFAAQPKDVQRVTLVKVWLNAIGADHYDEFVFRPNEGQPGGRAWNTAGSFIEAKEGPTPCFDKVMGLLLPEDCEWFLDWLADLVQNPSRILGTAVCITGPSRIGKSVLGNYIGRMLGRLYLLIESTVFAGRAFNAEEKDALLTHYDEAVASDLRSTLSIIKAKITSPTRRIEAKGIDAITTPNPMRYLLTSEHDPVPLMDGGTRSRFAILAMSAKLKGNRAFFDALGAEMDGDGPSHLLHFLLNRKITRDLRIAPDTVAARRNAKDHLPPLRRWLVESVEESCFVGGAPYKDKNGDEINNNAPWGETAHTPAIYTALVHWWKDRRLREDMPSREALAKMLGSLGCIYQGRLRVAGSEKLGTWTLLTPDQMAANIKALWQVDLD